MTSTQATHRRVHRGRTQSIAPQTPPRLDALQQQLNDCLANADGDAEALQQFAAFTAQLISADGVVYYANVAEQLEPVITLDVASTDMTAQQALGEASFKAATGQPAIRPLDAHRTIVAVPVTTCSADRTELVSGVGHDVLATVLSLGNCDVEPFILALQFVAANITRWHERQQRQQALAESQALAALLELVGEMESADGLHAAARCCVNKLAEFLGGATVAVGLTRSTHRNRTRLASLSGTAEFDARGQFTGLLEGAMNESLTRGKVTSWPTAHEERHATLAHRKLADTRSCRLVVTVPLLGRDGKTFGALAVIDPVQEATEIYRLLQLAGGTLGRALDVVKQAEGGIARRCARLLFGKRRGLQSRLVKAAVAVFAVAMFVPAPHRIACDCELVPLARRFAVAPHEGVLERAFVEPGQIVEAGQILARMDDRQIRWEMSGLLADLERAAKKRDSALAARDVPAAQMAQLEVERLEIRRKLLAHQQDNLEIRSTIDGVILSGDLNDAEGAPITIGQPLFEIALLKQLRLEVAVPERDLPHTRVGLPVSILLDGDGVTPRRGVVDSIKPESEVRNGRNVFIANVVLDSPDGRLRPGMSGDAKLLGQPRRIGWLLFHRPWERLAPWIY